jgi:hypothetical protein
MEAKTIGNEVVPQLRHYCEPGHAGEGRLWLQLSTGPTLILHSIPCHTCGPLAKALVSGFRSLEAFACAGKVSRL